MTSFELDLAHLDYRPGETVTGTVSWVGGSEKPPTLVAVCIEYVERTADYMAVAQSVASEALDTESIRRREPVAFGVTLPDNAFPACISPHGELAWEITVKEASTNRDVSEKGRLDVVPRRPPLPPPEGGRGTWTPRTNLRVAIFLGSSFGIGGALALHAPLSVYLVLAIALVIALLPWPLDRNPPPPPPEPPEPKLRR